MPNWLLPNGLMRTKIGDLGNFARIKVFIVLLLSLIECSKITAYC